MTTWADGTGLLPVPSACVTRLRKERTRDSNKAISRKRKLTMIDKTIGRTLAGGTKKSQETTLGVTQVLTLALIVGLQR